MSLSKPLYYQYTIGLLLIGFYSLFLCNKLQAQQPTMSSMGLINNNSSVSATIHFKSISNCIDVQSGISTFYSQKLGGEFAVNCEIKQQFNSLGLKIYPNPVQNIATIKLIHFVPMTESFNLSIWNAEGEFIKSLQENGSSLFQGIPIDLSHLSPGAYVLKMESPLYLEAVKFIKAK